MVALVGINGTKKPLIQFGHFQAAAFSFLRTQDGGVNVNGKFAAFVFPQQAGILHIGLFDRVAGLAEAGRAHRAVHVDTVRGCDLIPTEHLAAGILYGRLGLELRPLRDLGKVDFRTDRIPHIGLKRPLRDLDALAFYRMALQTGVYGLAFAENVPENDVREVAIVVKGDGIKAPIHRPVKINMPVLGVGFHDHATCSAALFELLPQDGDALLELSLEVFGAGVHNVLSVLGLGFTVLALAGDIPLHLKDDLSCDFGRNKSGQVKRLHSVSP